MEARAGNSVNPVRDESSNTGLVSYHPLSRRAINSRSSPTSGITYDGIRLWLMNVEVPGNTEDDAESTGSDIPYQGDTEQPPAATYSWRKPWDEIPWLKETPN
ncbi:hypothetical protein ACN38_g2561 [Penicillium nordicum]|uniref:Uncharacterized protein n=1 Tax=Penicillium nordicum TaxID=229535 RepID=A0A0M8P9S8_9EURO|nr:hypothetical protein ACN38_g2561 [Penicillium nordicum]